MAKKRLSESWEDLFADTATDEERVEEDAFLSLPDRRKHKPEPKKTVSRSSGKDFSESLDAFLEEALNAPGESEATLEVPARNLRKRKRRKIAGGGLDTLFSPTVGSGGTGGSEVKKLTLSLGSSELQQLRKIARDNQIPLRELVLDILTEYLEHQDKA